MKETTLFTGAFLPNASIYSEIESIDHEHLTKDLFDLKALENSQPFDHYYEFISEFCSQDHQDKVQNFIEAKLNDITSSSGILWLDPFACYSSDWINKELNSKVIYLVSHPVQFVNDYLHLDYDIDVNDLLSQKNLRRVHLAAHDHELTELLDSSKSVKKGIVLWKSLTRFILNAVQSSEKPNFIEVNDLHYLNSRSFNYTEINSINSAFVINRIEPDGMILSNENIIQVTKESELLWTSCIELLVHE